MPPAGAFPPVLGPAPPVEIEPPLVVVPTAPPVEWYVPPPEAVMPPVLAPPAAIEPPDPDCADSVPLHPVAIAARMSRAGRIVGDVVSLRSKH